jgi:opacity protein-like surface antigen
MGMFCLTLPVQAEMYVAGQAGVNIPQSISNVAYSAGGVTVESNDRSMQNYSPMYGGKAGYYFDSLKFQNFNLGVETELFNSTLHIEQQNVTIGGIDFGTQPGASLRVLTWAPVNIVVRYQAGAFEPYAGVGVGVFFSRITSGTTSRSSEDVGLNTQLGLRYRVNPNISLFGEWKYNYANATYTNSLGPGVDLSANYSANIFAFGVGYHF